MAHLLVENTINPIEYVSSSSGRKRVVYRNVDAITVRYWKAQAQSLMIGRNDQDWDWGAILRLHDSVLGLLPQVLVQSTLFSLHLDEAGVPRFPLGMAWCWGPCTVREDGGDGVGNKHTYLAFLSAAPKEYYDKRGLPELKVGKALIDAVVQLSLRADTDGRVLLHADPKADERLVDYYQRLGFSAIAVGKPFTIGYINPLRYVENDGRFMKMNAERGIGFLMANEEQFWFVRKWPDADSKLMFEAFVKD